MIIITKEQNINLNEIDSEIANINSMLENEKNLKNLLISYMYKISNAVNNMTNPANVNDIYKCLKNLKFNLDNINSLINSIPNLLNNLNNIKEHLNIQKITEYNKLYQEVFDKYLQTNNSVYSFVAELSQYISIAFPEKIIKEETVIYENIEKTENNSTAPSSVDNNSNNNFKENTLIISEKNQNVILPFTILELEGKLKKHSNEYKSIQDIINKSYTKPLSIYKNAPFSRFKEAFNLIKDREKGTLKQALDLGLELFFNYNLHPAIISACKNLDELDIYLDYLENGETNQFSCFNIVFDFAPVVIKGKRSQGF